MRDNKVTMELKIKITKNLIYMHKNEDINVNYLYCLMKKSI